MAQLLQCKNHLLLVMLKMLVKDMPKGNSSCQGGLYLFHSRRYEPSPGFQFSNIGHTQWQWQPCQFWVYPTIPNSQLNAHPSSSVVYFFTSQILTIWIILMQLGALLFPFKHGLIPTEKRINYQRLWWTLNTDSKMWRIIITRLWCFAMIRAIYYGM